MNDKRDLIVSLSENILKDIRNDRNKLSNVVLKAAELSHLVNLPANVNYFIKASKELEQAQNIINNYASEISAARDPNVSLASANPNERTGWGIPNHGLERMQLKQRFDSANATVGNYKAETYGFVMKILHTLKFSKQASNLLSLYKEDVVKKIISIYPEFKDSFESIDSNSTSSNPRDWAVAAAECRNLLYGLSRLLWQSSDKQYKFTDKDVVNLTGNSEKNKLLAYVDSKIGSDDSVQKGRKKRLFGIIHEVCAVGGKSKQKITKEEATSALVNTYILMSDLITYTDMKPII